MNYQLEQYKILCHTLNEEMTRFWTRYNILISLLLLLAAIFLKDFDPGKSDKIVFNCCSLFGLLMISIIIYQIVKRSITIFKNIYKTIQVFEEDCPNLKITKLFDDVDPQFRASTPHTYYLALTIPFCISVIIIGILIYILSIYVLDPNIMF